MVEVKNTKVFGLEDSLRRAGYPLSTDIDKVAPSLDRGKRLGNTNSGSGHDNFLRGIIVQFDIKYSGYFTKQFQRYNWVTPVSSQSTMHTLTKLKLGPQHFNKYVEPATIASLNFWITQYNEELEPEMKYYWFMKVISNLPQGYEMWMGVTTNYAQLKTIWHQRKSHKLKEDWGNFCIWMQNLPMFKELVLGGDDG